MPAGGGFASLCQHNRIPRRPIKRTTYAESSSAPKDISPRQGHSPSPHTLLLYPSHSPVRTSPLRPARARNIMPSPSDQRRPFLYQSLRAMPPAFQSPIPLPYCPSFSPQCCPLPLVASLTTPHRPASAPPTPRPPKFLSEAASRVQRLHAVLLEFERATRPGSLPVSPTASTDRYNALPTHVKGPSQMLGRLSPGCEGTRGVFPRCDFGCSPCYHSSDANRVRVDGMHTVTEIARQMDLLRRQRGPVGHCQLIGGEVTLLPPEDHALALETMRFFGRIPMSFSHGDFDYDYLKRLALKDGRRRFNRLDFAVHFDMEMRGRRDINRPRNEMELTPYRQKLVDMFERLRREHGIRYYLAHNMTVQAVNLPFIAQAVHESKAMGFRLMSFQPAAQQGAQKRWVENLRSIADDDGEIVWKEIEKGMGIRLPYSLFQMGDVRCNRMCACGILGPLGDPNPRIFPLFDDRCQHDVHCRNLIFQEFGNIVMMPHLLAVKLVRTILTKPWLTIAALRWCLRIVGRAGGLWPVLRRGIRPLTIVMHRFMDAKDVSKAWDLMDAGISTDDARVDEAGPRIRETMERLASCSYAMAQPDQGRVVPACVQHSVYDPVENKELAKLLSLRDQPQSATEAQVDRIRSGARHIRSE